MLSCEPSADNAQMRFVGVLRVLSHRQRLLNLPVQYTQQNNAASPRITAPDVDVDPFGNGIGLAGSESVVCWSHGRRRRLRRA
jgi:hypothetical protein